MKTRDSFVTNSSSSSFILILMSKKNIEDGIAYIPVRLNDICKDKISNKQELIDFFEYYYRYEDWKEDEYLKNKFEEMSNLIDEGEIFYCGQIANDDYGISSCLYDIGLNRLKLPDGVDIYMKIRGSFVTNSSSSSYLCIYKINIPKEDIEKKLGELGKNILDDYAFYGDTDICNYVENKYKIKIEKDAYYLIGYANCGYGGESDIKDDTSVIIGDLLSKYNMARQIYR